MGQTLAKIRRGSKHFEIIVDLDEALAMKKGDSEFLNVEGDRIFTDSKKGQVASASDLQEAFGTTDVLEVAKKIVKTGDVQTTQEHRSAEQEAKLKQVVDFLTTNAVDPQTGNPITAERIRRAIDESSVNIKNVPVENQIADILAEISKVIPIKIETKHVKITVPAIYTGQVYGVVAQYKEKEKWLDDGSLEVFVKVPSGLIMDFYDKLNSITHGSALTEDIKDE
jgi:ribosome maturation protein SDO1